MGINVIREGNMIHPDVSKHIESFDEKIQHRFLIIRQLIFDRIPHIEERLGYGVPGYFINKKNIIYMACFKHHIGLYPGSHYIHTHIDQLKGFKTSKGAIRIDHKQEIPVNLIYDILDEKE